MYIGTHVVSASFAAATMPVNALTVMRAVLMRRMTRGVAVMGWGIVMVVLLVQVLVLLLIKAADSYADSASGTAAGDASSR